MTTTGFRVIAYASDYDGSRYRNASLNAEELVKVYHSIFYNFFTPGQPWIEADQLWCASLYQGGYALTPSTAAPEDQYWLIKASMVTFRSENAAGSNPVFAEMTRASNLFGLPDEWYAAFTTGQTELTLVDYIYANGDFGVGDC